MAVRDVVRACPDAVADGATQAPAFHRQRCRLGGCDWPGRQAAEPPLPRMSLEAVPLVEVRGPLVSGFDLEVHGEHAARTRVGARGVEQSRSDAGATCLG